MRTLNAHALVGVVLLCLVSCASAPQDRQALASWRGTLPPRVEVSDTPFFPQDEFQCGPAALAMALNVSGFAVTPEVLGPELYLPDRRGSLQVEMLAAARRHGAIAYQLAPELADVFRELAAGTPVVVLQNLSLDWLPVWHYAVVVGFDLDREEIILRSGLAQRQVMAMATFENTWSRSGQWAMVALVPGAIPETAREGPFVAAVTASEKFMAPGVALETYEALSSRWPENLTVQIGIGNAAYRLHSLERAEQAFRQAIKDHPDSVAAYNNLAQTLADQTRYAEALAVARKAVSLGGPLEQAALETLAEIEERMK